MQTVLAPLPLTMDSADHDFSPAQWTPHRFTPSPSFDPTPDIEYPSPVASVAPSFQQPAPPPESTSTAAPADDFNQVQSSIGPDRVLTRRQKAALEGRRSSFPAAPRSPQTIRSHTPPASPHRERLSMNVSALQMPHPYPLTPDSSSTSYSAPYTFPQSQNSHSQSPSDPRSASPALSTTSSSASASSNHPQFAQFQHTPGLSGKTQKQRKQRLFNVDRKAICQYHRQHPDARQEDIASRYGVERSTISKILKHRVKWLSVPSDEELRISKHRPSKFPIIEEKMVLWLSDSETTKTSLSDMRLREKARQIARDIGMSEDRFKASSGWVENFKHRHGIRGGIWTGDGLNTRAARALGMSSPDTLLTPQEAEEAIRGYEARDREIERKRAAGLRPASWPQEQPTHHPSYNHYDSSQYEASSSVPPTTEQSSITQSSLQPRYDSTTNTVVPYDGGSSVRSPAYQTPSSYPAPAPTSPTAYPRPPSPSSSYPPAPPPDSYPVMEAYVPVPNIPDNSVPTLAEVEEHMNKVLLFFDTSAGMGVISHEDRENLNQVKRALFQAASGVPYVRE
ncbi:CenpB-DNA-bind-domain-containing protein [Guyanagaster necrorhizus]|uniref:CenpB-DNA-bind-domain-containing protein n=1 Tax=Guyanagaster necrorhizus TaxID=856835 RepID=A0A9P7VM33_9AGAR|nr:CenpB-DNA-bind-domain-containing protein [Guyanagaster necrorhizus MCA 3950]KAG7443102.1 CenpB-DNA-bind-domain-containing protein [Guyanagaster necrorhizus MCA 3950]